MASTSPEPADARRRHWEAVFQEKRDDETSWFEAHPRASLASIGRTGRDRSAKIVDVGAGASRLVDVLLDDGYTDVTALDISAHALATTRERLADRAGRVTWVVCDLLKWAPVAAFDVWHDRAVFHFMTSSEERRGYRDTLRTALLPGGQAIIATFAEDGPERCSGLPVVRYRSDQLAAELGTDLRLLESKREVHVTPAGRIQAFQYSRFERVR